MTFEAAAPVEVKAPGTGFSMSLQYGATAKKVRVTVTKAAQLEHFGGVMDGKTYDVMIGRDGDAGKILIRESDKGMFVAKKSAGDSVFLTINRWNLLPHDKRPAQSMTVATWEPGCVTLMVPDYSRVASAANNASKIGTKPNGLPAFAKAGRME